MAQGSTTNRQNLVQLKGVDIDTNNGNKSAGTQRIIIATDQPNLTTALNVNETARIAATGTKTQGTSVFSIQTISASTVVISSNIDVTSKFSAAFNMWWGRKSATAAGAGLNIRIEGYDGARWYPLALYTTAFAAAADEALTGTVNSGQKVLTCASTTGFTAGDLISIINGTLANSEFGRVKSISANTSVTIEDNLVNAQTSSTMYDSAECWAAEVPTTGYTTLRVVADASSFTQDSIIVMTVNTLDSIV